MQIATARAKWKEKFGGNWLAAVDNFLIFPPIPIQSQDAISNLYLNEETNLFYKKIEALNLSENSLRSIIIIILISRQNLW